MATSNVTYRGDISGILNVWAGQAMLIGTLLFPTILVGRQEDLFWKRAARTRIKAPDGTRVPGTTSKRDTTVLTQDTYQCAQHRLEAAITDEDKRKYAQWNIDWANMRAMDKANEILLAREVRIANKLINETTFPASGSTGTTLGTPWDVVATATPITDINTAQTAIFNRTGQFADTLVLPNMAAWVNLCLTNQVRESVGLKYTPGAQSQILLPESVILKALHPALTKLRIGGAVYDSTPDASSATLTAIWDAEYAFLCKSSDGGDDPTEACIGRTFAYTEEGGVFAANEYREDPIGSDIIGVQDCTDEKVLLTETGYLFKNIKS